MHQLFANYTAKGRKMKVYLKYELGKYKVPTRMVADETSVESHER